LRVAQILVLSSNATPARKTNAFGMTGTICDGSGWDRGILAEHLYHGIKKEILDSMSLVDGSFSQVGGQ
jgi:hypothetical protein